MVTDLGPQVCYGPRLWRGATGYRNAAPPVTPPTALNAVGSVIDIIAASWPALRGVVPDSRPGGSGVIVATTAAPLAPAADRLRETTNANAGF